MPKRFLCLLLAALLLLSLLPVLVLPSQAASYMKTSERGIAILKSLEGFRQYAYFDYTHYSIGYGSSCEEGEYPNGITEEEADALLREFLVDMESTVNGFANRNNLLFSQNQFDALMLFTYNVGGGWVYNDGEFRQAVLQKELGNGFIYPFALWSTAGGQMNEGLLKRRMIEADMFLNGNYSLTPPDHYTYVLYDNNGGEAQARVQAYDYKLEAHVRSVPTREGYTFLGWYSAPEGGSWIRNLTSAHAKQTLYAHWQGADVDPKAGTPASYDVPATELKSLEVFDAPGGNVISTLSQGSTAHVEADYVDGSGVKWGRITDGYWVILGNPRVGTVPETVEEEGFETTVTGDYVNVRRGPGTKYNVVAGVQMGDVIIITQTCYAEDVLWGKFRAGWICLEYTDYSGDLVPEETLPDIPVSPEMPDIPTTPEKPETPEKPQKPSDSVAPIATGIVNANQLNIRATAGSHGQLVGNYKKGDRVEILEKTTISGTDWGRTERGWICLSYVTLEEIEQETTAPTEPDPDVSEPSEPADPPQFQQGIPAVVTSKTGLNIRSGPGTKYNCVGSYTSGEKIQILEQTIMAGVAWGRSEKGWVCMQYVRLQDSQGRDSGVYGIVISTGGLNIRSGAGVGHAPVDSYPSGTRILIYEQTVVSGQKWGRTDKGWVCMDYVRLEDTAEKPTAPETTETETTEPPTEDPEQAPAEKTKTGTITASGLNIRRIPGTTGAVIGGYKRGDRVTILETKQVNGTTWGRTDIGWISLAYVRLDADSDNRTETGTNGTITADVLCIRMGPGTGYAVMGTYKQGQTVLILETVRVETTTWGRTDLGWICMNYVK